MKQICIFNAHWSNRGDEAALRAIIDMLSSKYYDIHIQVIFKDRQEIKFFPYHVGISFFSCQFLPENEQHFWDLVEEKDLRNDCVNRLIAICKNADLLVYAPGGAVISDRFWWKKQLEYMLPIAIAEKYQIPVVMAAPSVGPFTGDVHMNNVRQKLLQKVKCICVREECSKRYLCEIGVKDNVFTTIDTTFYDLPVIEENEKIYQKDIELCAFMESNTKIIAMTVSDFCWHVTISKNTNLIEGCEKAFIKFIEILKNDNIGVLFIPQLFGNQNDSVYLEKFMNSNTYILSEQYDTYFQQYIISKCYAVVGMRYHSNIFAAKMGVPFIAIGYEEKMIGFMDEWEMQEYLINLEQVTIDELMRKWILLNKYYLDFKEMLRGHSEVWKQLAGMTMDAICNEIDKI